jgi:hypothetical protein
MIWLTVCGNALGSNRIGLAGNNYNLSDLNCLSLSETDGVYGVADPCVGGRIIIRTACCRVRHSIINAGVTRQAELMRLWTALISPTGSNI